MKLQDKVAIITGASRGIGKAIALLFAKEGAKVVVNYNSSENEANMVVKEITESGGNSVAIQCDITKEEDVKKLILKTLKNYKKIDILVNNACEILRPSNWECDLKTWSKSLETTLTGHWQMTKFTIPYLKKQKSAAVIFTASYVGILGSQYVMPYGAGKAGIINIMKSFAKELAPDIRVNSISPGNIDTDMTKGAGEEFIQKITNNTPLKRLGKAEEVAKTALFLASQDSSFITGVNLEVDGGYLLVN